MKTYQNLTKKTKVGLAVSAILSAMTILNNVEAISKAINNGRIFTAVAAISSIVMALLVLWYTFAGYKKPHGNMLRAVFFAFSVHLVIGSGLGFMKNESAWAPYFPMFAAITVSYISGRLNKIEKNKKLLVFTGVLLIIDAFCNIFNGRTNSITRIYCLFSNVIFFTALSFAYIARYEEHKAAGLEDAN